MEFYVVGPSEILVGISKFLMVQINNIPSTSKPIPEIETLTYPNTHWPHCRKNIESSSYCDGKYPGNYTEDIQVTERTVKHVTLEGL